MASFLTYTFTGQVWSYKNPNEVFFVSLPVAMSEDILDVVGTSLNPWGTVPCRVIHGDATWESSMFPRKDRGCYDLPLNLRIRREYGLQSGQSLTLTIEIDLLP